jgi:hypothetical protein
MKLEKPKAAPISEEITEAVAKLAPRLNHATQFVLKNENQQIFGKSDRDGELVVHINNSDGVKTTMFETDGQYKDGIALPWKDGYSRNRHITNFTYCLIENLVKGEGGASKVVQTCYVRDKMLLLQLRLAIGHKGF